MGLFKFNIKLDENTTDKRKLESSYRRKRKEYTNNEKDIVSNSKLTHNYSRLNRPTYLKNKSLINRVKRINRPKTSHKQAFKQNRQFSSKLKVFPKLRPKSVLLKKHCAKVFVRLTILVILYIQFLNEFLKPLNFYKC